MFEIDRRHIASASPDQQLHSRQSYTQRAHRTAHTHYHTKQRWIAIATMMELGEGLPLISLVQVGDTYFVRDGHHRISVARALGYAYIDANVTVWDVIDTAACACHSAAPQLA